MNYILYDTEDIDLFYPFTFTRPLSEMRLASGTVREIWQKFLGERVSCLTRNHIKDLYPAKWGKKNVLINSAILPNDKNVQNSFLFYKEKVTLDRVQKDFNNKIKLFKKNELKISLQSNKDFLFEMFNHCGKLKSNYSETENVFFDDSTGPIYLEENVQIMSGAMIKGPVYICRGSTIKMGAKIYGPTVIGPQCKIGGEISNCIFLGHSNKAHDGFLGHSIIGEWCNIGAGTCNSNLKNDYGEVKMWNYRLNKFVNSEMQFLGMFMGDHSKCSINSSFNTGTTIGVCCNLFGPGLHRNYIPSFSWGGNNGFKAYQFEKAIEVAEIVMRRRNVKISKKYIKMFRNIHDNYSF